MYISIIAKDQESIKKILESRYNVYCLEKHYYPPEQFANGLETDEFDEYSVFIAISNVMSDIVGSTRLIKFTEKLGLPILNDFILTVNPNCLTGEIYEISRFIIPKEHRNDKELLYQLFGALYKYAYQNKITYYFASIDRILFLYLKKFGVEFIKIGEEKQYHGHCVVPSYIKIEDMLTKIKNKMPDLYQILISDNGLLL